MFCFFLFPNVIAIINADDTWTFVIKTLGCISTYDSYVLRLKSDNSKTKNKTNHVVLFCFNIEINLLIVDRYLFWRVMLCDVLYVSKITSLCDRRSSAIIVDVNNSVIFSGISHKRNVSTITHHSLPKWARKNHWIFFDKCEYKESEVEWKKKTESSNFTSCW